jgi:hypothetical protein
MAWPLVISTGRSRSCSSWTACSWPSTAPSPSRPRCRPACSPSRCAARSWRMAGYANTFVAQYHGSGDPAGCSRATAQGVWMALLSWPLILLLIPVGRLLLRSAGHPADVLAEELQYLTILMAGGVTIPVGRRHQQLLHRPRRHRHEHVRAGGGQRGQHRARLRAHLRALGLPRTGHPRGGHRHGDRGLRAAGPHVRPLFLAPGERASTGRAAGWASTARCSCASCASACRPACTCFWMCRPSRSSC